MQKLPTCSVKTFLESSVFMINAERITPSVWASGSCQYLLYQIQPFMLTLGDVVASIGVSKETPEAVVSQHTLLLHLLRETIVPFYVKWFHVFFNRKHKARRWVTRGKRKAFKSDFLAVQVVVVELAAQIAELEVKVDVQVRTSNKPSRNGVL